MLITVNNQHSLKKTLQNFISEWDLKRRTVNYITISSRQLFLPKCNNIFLKAKHFIKLLNSLLAFLICA